MDNRSVELLKRYSEDYSDFVGLHLSDVNQRGHGMNRPLHIAAYDGQLDDVRTLLAAGADINLPGDGGLTALHFAAMAGDSSMVDLLMVMGSDRDRKDDDGLAAADWAKKLNHSEAHRRLTTVPMLPSAR
jgi:hypothetical protein